MPGKINKLDIIGNLGLRPEKVPDLFKESELQQKLYIKRPNWDSVEKTEELFVLENDREHVEMLQQQQEMLEHEHHRSHINKNRIEELLELQDKIRERFIEVNNFFKDCDEKKIFAENKVSEEKRVHAKLKNAISETKENVETLSAFRDVLKDVVDKYKPYEVVIQQVVDSKDNKWSSTKDVIYGCDALMMAAVEIVEMQRQKLQEIDEAKIKIMKITNVAMLEVLGLNNELSELERAYANITSQCLQHERIIVNTKNCLIDNGFTRWKTLNEISIIYRTLCRRRGLSLVYRITEVEKQLDFIKDEIGILRHVIQECLNAPKREKTKKKT